MTFKMDSLGFYKNRKGEKVEIVNFVRDSKIAISTNSFGYWLDGHSIDLFEDDRTHDIISKWVETPELEDFAFTKGTTGIKHPQQAHKFYLVFNPQQSAPKYQHKTFEEAKAEAKRITAKYPKQKVYVLETVTCYTASVDVQEVGVV